MRRVRTGDQEDPGTRAPRDQGTKGPGDQGTRGPRDQRTRGPEEQGTEDQGTRGPGDQRIKGTLNCFSSKFRICFQGLRFLQKFFFFQYHPLLHFQCYGMLLHCCTFSCVSTHSSCYATVRSYELPRIRDATPLYVLLHFHTYVMLRH